MRPFQDIEKRWSLLWNTSIGVDLRQAVRDEADFDPCEDGLRSVCWKSFLLNGPLSKATWVRKLNDSRSGYTSLRDHFLKFIDNPNDLHSSTDPLADDDMSPWATLRQDEVSREEIWQDVIRCNIDNYFFREPSTQRKLLDILFIYSKLNPDTGYRQGMHELLAPVLWVVHQDSVNTDLVPDTKRDGEGIDLMLQVLDSSYVEHDTFNIFCAIMQTCKTFYEIGESKDSSAIVAQSEKIQKELLAVIDPELSTHLEVAGIIPQIWAIRWLRLLFGREFEFKDVLKLWDGLFAESLNLDIVDMVCIAILLRMRWQLVDADYTSAITSLTKLNLPKEGDSARAIIKDAVYLAKRRTAEAGAEITQLRTGKRQYIDPLSSHDPVIRAETPQARTHRRLRSQQASPSPSPARFVTPQKHLESLFSNVSNSFQKNSEGWNVQNVSKALRGAVGEARRNFEHIQSGHSRNSSVDATRQSNEHEPLASHINANLADKLQKLEERNHALAKMLETAQETLRKWHSTNAQQNIVGEDVFNTALARIQFVSVYLTDSEIPIPVSSPDTKTASLIEPAAQNPAEDEANMVRHKEKNTRERAEIQQQDDNAARKPADTNRTEPETKERQTKSPSPTQSSVTSNRDQSVRPSLAESSFSFMLGEDRHRSSFVRSTPLPEDRRRSEAEAQVEKKGKDTNETRSSKKPATRERKPPKPGGGEDDSDQDGFTMSPLQ